MSIHQEDKTIVNILHPTLEHLNTLNNSNRFKERSRKCNNSREVNTLLSKINRLSRKKINKVGPELYFRPNGTMIYRTCHPTKVETTFLSCAHRTSFSRIDHMLSHRTGLSNFKMLVIIPSIFSDYSGVMSLV